MDGGAVPGAGGGGVTREIAHRVLEFRRAAGLTQEELAYAAGISTRSVSDIERGRRTPRAQTLDRLAEALAVERSSLVNPPPDLDGHPTPSLIEALERIEHMVAIPAPTPPTPSSSEPAAHTSLGVRIATTLAALASLAAVVRGVLEIV